MDLWDFYLVVDTSTVQCSCEVLGGGVKCNVVITCSVVQCSDELQCRGVQCSAKMQYCEMVKFSEDDCSAVRLPPNKLP